MVEQTSGSTNGKRRRRGRKSGESEPTSSTTKKTSSSPSAGGVATVKNNNNSKVSETPYYQPHNALLIQWDSSDAEPWYKYGQSLPDRDAVVVSSSLKAGGGDPTKQQQQQPSPFLAPPSLPLVQKYRGLADALYRREVQLFNQQNNHSGSNKDDRWVESTMRQGTLKDRIAAMSVVVSTHPVHKFYALDGLLQMAGCGISNDSSSSVNNNKQPNSRVAQLAAEALEDLFLHTFLPIDRKLLTLAQRPLNKYENHNSIDDSTKPLTKNNKKKKTQKTLSPRILLLWRFEEMVKEKYDFFLRHYLAHTLHHSALELPKTAALRSTANLLRLVPEGEALLLDMLVNKLGDPVKAVAATAAHELRRTLQQHSAMLPVVAREVQQLAHRPHLSRRALYNCVTFLNQLQLTRESRTAASMASNKNSSTSKESPSLAASLIRTYFRLFEVAIQSDKKKIGGSSSSNPKSKEKKRDTSNDDSNNTSHSRLLSALLTGVNRAHPYLPATDPALEEHVDALYRIVHTAPLGARTQSLLLLFHLAVGASSPNNPDHTHHRHHQRASTQEDNNNSGGTDDSRVARRDRFYRALYSTLAQPGMLDGGKHLTMYFNLLYKAIKHDTDTTRQIVFGKRILATTLHGTAAVVAASLFLMEHVSREHPVLRTCYHDHWNDEQSQRVLDPTKREPRGALVLLDVTGNGDPNDNKQDYSRETKAAGWEVSLLAHHYHPAVPKFVASLGDDPNDSSQSNNSQYSGDPLKDFALAPFLDKFAYRNPKSVQRVANKFRRGESVAERRSGTDSVLKQQFAIPVNDPSFLEQGVTAVEDEFFYNFFAERAKRDQEKGIVRYKSDDRKEADDGKAEELEALEKIEEDIDGRNFADFETGWETDEDEEAFVDSLAEKIIEDAVDAGHGPDDLDDEDPDMDGWDDMSYDDDDNSMKDNGKGKNVDSENGSDAGSDVEADDDDFMDGACSSSDDDSDDEPAGGVRENSMFHVDSDDTGSASEESQKDEDNSHDEGDLAFANESSASDNDDEAPELVKLPAKADASGTFAPAEDYEELIAKSWSERKRVSSLHQQGEKDDAMTCAAPMKEQAKKSRKRRKTR